MKKIFFTVIALISGSNSFGRFLSPDQIFKYNGSFVSSSVADLDNDGFKDIVLLVSQPDKIYLLLNNGYGSFYADSSLISPSDAKHILTADINNDGNTDIIVSDGITGEILLYKNTGEVVFDSPFTLVGGYNIPGSITLFNANNDNYTDIIIFFPSLLKAVCFINQQNNTFTPTDTLEFTSNQINLLTVDIDDDSDTDLAVSIPSDSTQMYYLNDDTARFPTYSIIDTTRALHLLASADFNSNGLSDLLFTNENKDTILLYLNDPPGILTITQPVIPAGQQYILTTGDTDGSGINDILSYSSVTGRLDQLRHDNLNSFLPPDSIYSTFDTIEHIIAEDMNIDGMNDLLIFNKASHTVSLLLNTLNSGITNHIVCAGNNTGSISVTTGYGKPPYSYIWNNGRTTEDISGLAAGNYNLTITDDLMKEVILRFTISIQYPELKCNAAISGITCIKPDSGIIILRPSGGLTPYSFIWSTGYSGDTLAGLPSGSYSVTLTDFNSCTTDTTVQLPSPPSFKLSALLIHPRTPNPGSITLFISEGTTPYAYNWSNNSSNSFINGLSAGTYTVTITDGLGCKKDSSFLLILNSAIIETNSQSQPVIFPNPSLKGQPVYVLLPDDLAKANIYLSDHRTATKIHCKQHNRNTLYISGLDTGIYFVMMETAEKTLLITKLVVQ